MKIPAIISEIGTWNYYISSMTFGQIDTYVRKIDKELHKSEKLSELLQRAITSNYKKISEYILEHEDRFFNAIVLAVYEGDPQYREVDFEFEGERFGTMGLIEFTGKEIIFPVDGQHRVEGIKKALTENPNLKSQTIPVIFIGHRNTPEGMERTRRLFSTLNRYAKPVKKSEIIALDEDDLIAITTRYLVENHRLFSGERISLSTTLKENNTLSFTTIETLYDCNSFIFNNFFKENELSGSLDTYLRTRPSDEEIEQFNDYCTNFWNHMITTFKPISDYLELNEKAIQSLRHREGGNLLFRPNGLSPFVKAICNIKRRTGYTYQQILDPLQSIDMSLTAKPWKYLLWSTHENKVITRNASLVELLFIYIYQKHSHLNLLSNTEVNKMKEKYASKLALRLEDIDEALDEF